jgi:hypothetical protein
MAGLISKVKIAGKSLFSRFNVSDPKVTDFLRRDTGEALVEMLVDEQITLARKAIADGIRDGMTDRQIADLLIGKYSRKQGRAGWQNRQGGLIGLGGRYQDLVMRARRELQASNFDRYLERELRDKRFDRLIARAVRDGKPLTALEVDAIAGRYSDRLLEYRASVIGDNEAQSAIMFSRYRAVGQTIESGELKAYQVQKIWLSRRDERVRYSHVHLDGMAQSLRIC